MHKLVKIANLPTPIEFCENITNKYGYNIYIKRDDLQVCAQEEIKFVF